MRRPLILGSTSPYRRMLLERLRLPFTVDAPRVDETPLPGETPVDLARRLARAKAREVSLRHPEALVLGSDQVADLDGHPLGKPGDHAGALRQLQAMRGRSVTFHSAVVLRCEAADLETETLAPVRVQFRHLSDGEIERYLQLEQPYDSAGSARVEALGIVLLSTIESDDPTALIGLPLIRTCEMLRQAGVDPIAPTA